MVVVGFCFLLKVIMDLELPSKHSQYFTITSRWHHKIVSWDSLMIFYSRQQLPTFTFIYTVSPLPFFSSFCLRHTQRESVKAMFWDSLLSQNNLVWTQVWTAGKPIVTLLWEPTTILSCGFSQTRSLYTSYYFAVSWPPSPRRKIRKRMKQSCCCRP